MIKKLWQRLVSKRSKHTAQQLRKVERSLHNVSRKNISRNALKVLYRLNNAGYQAYLVGGGVRDILLGLSPKDFDIATNATPEEVKQLFKNCRLIGRRFRLAHILFGREVIEVATFRAGHEESCQTSAKTSAQGLLVRDNVYGNLEEDAFRRDFTVNALYYSAEDFSVLDYVSGLDDLKKKQLRLIGDPETRYREDPVRILRAVRLSCKLGLKIEENTAAPIRQLSEMLAHVSPARLWDESNKLFLAGYAHRTWHELLDRKIANHLFPETLKALSAENNHDFAKFIDQALLSTDNRIKQQLAVTPAFLFAVFLWRPQQLLAQKFQKKGLPPFEASQKAAARIFDLQRQTIAVPKRFSITAREIWSLQFRLNNRRQRSVNTIIQNPKFRAAYDFLCLRAGNDPQLSELADWWTEYQEASQDKQQQLIQACNNVQPKKKRKNYKRNKKKRYSPNKKSIDKNP